MTTTQNSPDLSGILQDQEDTTNVVQPQEPQKAFVPEEDYKNLQSFATRTRQFAIKTAMDAVEANPQYISSIEDKSIQDAVVKHKYGFDNYEQLIAVLGDNFYATSQSEGNDDENISTTKLEKEVRLLKYQQEKSIIDNAIANFKMSNPQLFTSDDSEMKLREELKNISTSLPIEERIRKCAKIALSSSDPSSVAFSVLNGGRSPTNSGGSFQKIDAQKMENEKQIRAGRKLFGLPDKP